MKVIAVTQRVVIEPAYKEKRDALDQRWTDFLRGIHMLAVPVPNNTEVLAAFLEKISVDGIVLSGGGDLTAYGGDSPERDAVEEALIQISMENQLPVVGICRGMQAIQHIFGVPLESVGGHVTSRQTVLVNGQREVVNSYHTLGSTCTVPELQVWARAEDGVVEAVSHRDYAIHGLMWHPERISPYREADREFFMNVFGVGTD